jgi:hypothetical protein
MMQGSIRQLRATAGCTLAGALALGVAMMLMLAGSARAEVTYLGSFGESGATAGHFSEPGGVAVNNSSEDVYVVDRKQNRIEEFTAGGGSFIRAWGYGVVKSGPDNVPAPEVQAVTIKATSGTFTLKFGAKTTEPIAWNASASTVETELNALSTINTGGGSVSVTGGPGDATGSSPYVVVFGGGPLNDTNVSLMTLTTTDLGVPAGTQITCSVGPAAAPTKKIQWLRNGVPIAGAESSPYTTVAADEGKLIQCKGLVTSQDEATSVRASSLALPVSPATGVEPVPGSPSVSGTAKVGEELTCAKGTWSGAPVFTYQWLRDGNPIAGAEAEKYTLTAADLQTEVQCEVIGTNANGVAVADSTPTLVKSVPPSNSGTAGTGPVVTGTAEVGQTLTCANGTWTGAAGFAYQWLRNGGPIGGAEATEYTLVSADEGAAVQCEVKATNVGGTAVAISNRVVIQPVPSPEPPARPSSAIAVSGTRNVGQTLTCSTGAWTPSTPAPNFTYKWLRNGVPIGGQVAETYVLTAADLDKLVQCEVTAANSSGTSSAVSAASAGVVFKTTFTATATATQAFGTTSSVVTTIESGEAFEVCKVADTCQAGRKGSRMGQFDAPRSVEVDNSEGGAGDVWVVDDHNYRVEKFSATGEPLLMIGKNVNQTTGGNLCPVEPGDVCKIGIRETGPEPGAFGGWEDEFSGDFGELGEEVAVDSAGNVYVGDPRNTRSSPGGPYANVEARIQKFSPAGAFIGQVKVPSKSVEEDRLNLPISVGVDSVGRVFASLSGPGEPTNAIEIFQPGEFGLEEIGPEYLKRDAFAEPEESHQVAIGPNDDKIWVINRNAFGLHVCDESGEDREAIVAYDAGGNVADCTAPTEEGELQEANGLAISPGGLVYVSTGNEVRYYEAPTPAEPVIQDLSARKVTTETAALHGVINPGFELTTYTFEYGPDDCSSNPCTVVPGPDTLNGLHDREVEVPLDELTPDTKYHFRLITENRLGEDVSVDRTFTTFPFVNLQNDPCDNALARKQTGAASLDDCRAYELASAGYTGGFDVESDLVNGQTPYSGFPEADGKLLYAVHDGGIPNTGSPTNRGPDPYLAVRGSDGSWTTRYVGLPANATPSEAPFSSGLLGADAGLQTFAFGGDDFCSPCFPNGSSGIPVRMPDGSLVQGMTGKFDQGASAIPNGLIQKPLSEDGSHLVFGSLLRFQPDGNNNTGDISIYERDLQTGVTQVVSKTPGGANLPCLQGAGTCHGPGNPDGIAELDISSDGSRVLIGQKVGTDAEGNVFYHLYMHLGTAPNTIDLTPGTVSGVGFAGMTSDATRVFFTTREALEAEGAEDNDTSADLYRADVGSSSATLTRVSVGTGGTGDTDGCDPANNTYNLEDWNTIPGGPADCSVVAIGGGGGVSTADGAVYFLSPERLDGEGVDGAPNLFVAHPGSDPHFVATLESGANEPVPTPAHQFLKSLGSFSNVEGAAIDPPTGSVYALDNDSTAGSAGAYVQKFEADGSLDKSFGVNGEIDGSTTEAGSFLNYGLLYEHGFPAGAPLSIAVDPDPESPNYRDLYVPDYLNRALWKFGPDGEYLGKLSVPGGEPPTGVAVSPKGGKVYVVGILGHGYTFDAEGNLIEPSAYEVPFHKLLDIGVDSTGKIYISDGSATHIYTAAGVDTGTNLTEHQSLGVKVDPADDHVFVEEEGNKVVEFDPSGTQVGEAIGVGKLKQSVSLAADSGRLAISNRTSVVTYSPIVTPHSSAYDSPLVIDSVRSAGKRIPTEFQTNPSGNDAVFSTSLPLTDFDSGGKYELYRYDVPTDRVDCASCLPSEAIPESDAQLPSHGLGLTDNGRVFFNTDEQLVLRDTNGKQDAYEWENGHAELISTGNSAFDSGLLSVTADGKDAFFFTRQPLVPNDLNGQAMKIYDARDHGGAFVIPGVQPCKASDECHGPGTQAAVPPQIGTHTGTGGQEEVTSRPPHCKKGFVKRHGKCVKKTRHGQKKKSQHRHRRAHRARVRVGADGGDA